MNSFYDWTSICKYNNVDVGLEQQNTIHYNKKGSI